MSTPLEELEFLTRSSNRVAVLDALTEAPQNRDRLQERTGVSRVTLHRILTDVETMDWVERDGRTYRATRLGTLVTEEFGELHRLLRTVDDLQRS